MEPPPKRLRIARGEVSSEARTATYVYPTQTSTSLKPTIHSLQHEQQLLEAALPTRTLDLSNFQRRSLENRGVIPKRNRRILLAPRAPDVTVTANVVNIAIVGDTDQTQTTEIAAPTADTAIMIGSLGTLTVAGVSQITSGIDSTVSTITSGILTEDTSTLSLTSTSSVLLPTNGTSSDRTITVTSTSTLEVSFRNGTAYPTSISLSSSSSSSSHHKSTIVTDGTTTTVDIDDSSSTSNPTPYVFGDFTASATITPTGNSLAGSSATTTTSSSSSATSTDSGSGGGGGVVLTPQQQQVVGGVVGGVAGIAVVLVALLYFLKWYRRRLKAQGRLPEQLAQHRQLPGGESHEFSPATAMVENSRSSFTPIVALKQSLNKLRPNSMYTLTSNATDRSSVPTAASERSFQRVSGRKIPSVLLTGGNGYDDPGFSPPSEYSVSRSRDVSQTGSFRDSNNSTNPLLGPGASGSASGYSTPIRSQASPFADPSTDGIARPSLSVPGGATNTRDFARMNASRSQLSLQTSGLAAFDPSRHMDGVTIRPSPARTPTTASPTSSSLRLPMHTPPMMAGDIPEMPPLHPLSNSFHPRQKSEGATSLQRSIDKRSVSAISARSSGSVGGKFKEDF